MLVADLASPLAAHLGLIVFTLISIGLFAYLLYRLIHPEGG